MLCARLHVFKLGNLGMCSPAMFANNAQMVDKNCGLLPREFVYLTHGSALDISGKEETINRIYKLGHF